MPELMLVVDAPVATDLEEYYAYLNREAGTAVAKKFLVAARATFEFLMRNPSAGAPKGVNNTSLQGIRQWRVKGFSAVLIFYLANDEVLRVVRVLHSARNIEAIFDDD